MKEIALKARMQKNATLELDPLKSRYKKETFDNDDISVIKSVKSDASLDEKSRNVVSKRATGKNLININVMEPTTMHSG